MLSIKTIGFTLWIILCLQRGHLLWLCLLPISLLFLWAAESSFPEGEDSSDYDSGSGEAISASPSYSEAVSSFYSRGTIKPVEYEPSLLSASLSSAGTIRPVE